jgi:NADH-quinone oxidoreductase subunit M
MGPVREPSYNGLPDARWNERYAAGLLILGILIIGVAPFYLSDLLRPNIQTILHH